MNLYYVWLCFALNKDLVILVKLDLALIWINNLECLLWAWHQYESIGLWDFTSWDILEKWQIDSNYGLWRLRFGHILLYGLFWEIKVPKIKEGNTGCTILFYQHNWSYRSIIMSENGFLQHYMYLRFTFLIWSII